MRRVWIALAWILGIGVGVQVFLYASYMPAAPPHQVLRASECARLCFERVENQYGSRNVTLHGTAGCDILFSLRRARPALGVVPHEDVTMTVHRWNNYTYRADCRRNVTRTPI